MVVDHADVQSVQQPAELVGGGHVSSRVIRALDGAPALARLGLLDLDTPPRLLAPAITSLRVYAGYSGGSPGQLEAEIDEGAWYVLPAQPGDVFAADPDRLWRQVLRRQDGDMAFLATYPDDPSQN